MMRYLILLVASSLVAQVPDDIRARLFLTYWVCINPTTTPPCVSTSKSTADCPGCAAWRKENLGSTFDLEKIPAFQPANIFISKIATDAYGTFPMKDGRPIGSKELYENHRAYGWLEVPRDQPKAGSIVVWPHLAGWVFKDTADNPSVLYPSGARDEPHTTGANQLTISVGAEPRYLIPASILQEHAQRAPQP